jgi:hypothetical protein
MCQKCVDALRDIFPDETDKARVEILVNYTSFPFGTPEMIRKQLEHLKEVGVEQVDREIDELLEKVARERRN